MPCFMHVHTVYAHTVYVDTADAHVIPGLVRRARPCFEAHAVHRMTDVKINSNIPTVSKGQETVEYRHAI
jgi:hypothetical protein